MLAGGGLFAPAVPIDARAGDGLHNMANRRCCSFASARAVLASSVAVITSCA
jgi:hypothetical protein